ncbi:hypothetical protein C1646_754017 [Rhizophagus diaphanus]|nr:hypothetical protein C1646_754017 [Rhizophagus diaphanus] [Rhizophagus sp. MUCL 43196]
MIHYSYAEESEISQLIKLNWFTPLTYKVIHEVFQKLMNLVYIYDTINDFWSTKGSIAVLGVLNNIIIRHWHLRLSYNFILIGLDSQRVIVFGGIPTAASRMNHRANVVVNYMENDILLLDISNVDEYIWTNEFNPSSSIVKSPLPTVPTIPTKPSQRSYLYKWNKNRNKDGNNLNNKQANTNSQTKRNYYPGQEAVQPPSPALVIDRSYNHGREIPNDEIQELKQEIHDLRQIILQSNKQSTSSMRNN